MKLFRENQFKGSFSHYLSVGIGVLSVLFLTVIISRFIYPFDSGFAEAFNWIPATHLIEGKNPYAYSFTPPYSMTPYGIVFYALLAVGVKLFGLQLWWGKLLSLLAFTGCLWGIAGITRKLTFNHREAVLFACLAGLAMYPAQFTIAVVRSTDLIAAAFSLGAFALALKLTKNEKTKVRQVLVIVLLLGAAFFTKHTSALGFGFVFLRLLQLGKWRDAFLSGLLWASIIAGGIYLLNYTSSGGYVWQHFTHARRLPHSFADSLYFFGLMLQTPTFFLFLVLLLFWAYQKRKLFYEADRSRLMLYLRSPQLLIILYFTLSFGWAFVSAGRVGANVNYYTEASFLAAVICGLIYADFRHNDFSRTALAAIVLLTLGGMFQQARILRGEYFRWQSLSYYREVFETVGKLTSPGDKCVSNMPELVAWNGCAFHFDDFADYSVGWTPELRQIFETQIKSGEYKVIVWGDENLQREFPNYKLVPMSQKLPDRYYPVYVFVPTTHPLK